MREGYIHVYTGCGKGKTTAALGLALRAAGAGLRVYIAQFIKQKKCSEHRMIDKFGDLVTIKRYGRGFILNRKATNADLKAAQAGLKELKEIIRSKKFDVVVLDEANIATHYGLLAVEDLLDIMATKPKGTELVITGRHADSRVIQNADLVTEMKEIKHYRKKGVKARTGIEY